MELDDWVIVEDPSNPNIFNKKGKIIDYQVQNKVTRTFDVIVEGRIYHNISYLFLTEVEDYKLPERRERAIEEVEKLVGHYKDLDSLYEKLRDLFGASPESSFFESVFLMFDDYMQSVSDNTGIHIDALSWFVYNNQCGAEGLELDGKKIWSVSELVAVEVE